MKLSISSCSVAYSNSTNPTNVTGRTHHGWVNNNAQDRWWWEERACDCSSLVEPVTPGGYKNNVRGANVVYTVDDCFSSGLDYMEPGKCYSINPDRAPYSDWMNNDARDTWWWREVSCGGEEEDDDWEDESWQCAGSGFLQKKSLTEESYNKRESASHNSYEVWEKNTKFFYDVLGRKTQARPETRRYLFSPKIDRTSKSSTLENDLFRMVMSDGSICGEEGVHYGILEDGKLKGGIYCYDLDIKGFYRKKVLSENPDYFCGENNNSIRFTFEYKYAPIVEDDVNYVRVGYEFPNGYITKKQDEDYFKNHEERHRKDTDKIIEIKNRNGRKATGREKKVFIERTMCKSDYCAWADETAELLRIEKRNFYKAKIDSAKEYYHDQCYNHGKCN